MQPNLPNQVCARPIVCFFKNTLTWDHIGMRNKMVRNVFPNHKFKNNMFYSQIGTQSKTVLIYQFRNNVFHSQIRTRNKTVLIYQFGNNVFHSLIGTRTKKVLNDQFGNNVFNWQIGTRNKTVLIDQFGTERCVPFTDRSSKQNGPN